MKGFEEYPQEACVEDSTHLREPKVIAEPTPTVNNTEISVLEVKNTTEDSQNLPNPTVDEITEQPEQENTKKAQD